MKMRYDDGVVSICRSVWSLIPPRVGRGGDAFQNKLICNGVRLERYLSQLISSYRGLWSSP